MSIRLPPKTFRGPPPPKTTKSKVSKKFDQTPQELVAEFWEKYFAKKSGKVTSIFPRSLYATLLPPIHPRGQSSTKNAAESYEAAAKECRDKVARIVRECNRNNEKFTDPDFDIEYDMMKNCLNGLWRDEYDVSRDGRERVANVVGSKELRESLKTLVNSHVLGPDGKMTVDINIMKRFVDNDQPALEKKGVKGNEFYPGSIHRLDWVFESPKFTVDGYSSTDIKQGYVGDCSWVAAVATIAHREDLMDRVCVARDEEAGVYGFVFYRDGEWVSTVVDDNLYLLHKDFQSDEKYDRMGRYDPTGSKALEHRRRYQTGSEALYFAQCADKNETWLPILEKAYAKIHGDYEAISGGYPGEAVEDMTGGVTTTVMSNRVFRKDKLWQELVNLEGEFVFAASAFGRGLEKSGMATCHAYSILKATEEVDEDGKKVRLVQIRNPWGKRGFQRGVGAYGEWSGPWSDGSKEWTPYWLTKMNHTFGDDGIFWMSYQDLLENFDLLHRTRLFDEKWTVVQQWTSINVGWVSGYLNSKFVVDIKNAGTVVLVLAKLDDRYFHDLEGQYEFALHFVLQNAGAEPGDHICRVRPVLDCMDRSVSCEVELQPGQYEVLPKILATRDSSSKKVEDVIKVTADRNPQKLRQVGMAYDLAHAKGGVPDEDEMLTKKKAEEKKKEEEKKRRRKAKAKREKERVHKVVLVKPPPPPPPPPAQDKYTKPEDKKEDDDSREKERVHKVVKAPPTQDQDTKPEDKKPEDKKEDDDSKDEQKVEHAVEKAGQTDKGRKQGEKAHMLEGKDDKSSPNGTAPPTTESTTDGKVETKVAVETKAENQKESKAAEKKEEETDDDDEDEEEEPKEMPTEEDKNALPPWNAVCVLGLRVYARDPDVTISLVKPKDAEEASALSIDAEPAGATT